MPRTIFKHLTDSGELETRTTNAGREYTHVLVIDEAVDVTWTFDRNHRQQLASFRRTGRRVVAQWSMSRESAEKAAGQRLWRDCNPVVEEINGGER